MPVGKEYTGRSGRLVYVTRLRSKLYCIVIFADVWYTLPVWDRQPLSFISFIKNI